jgi:ABC-type microcin C transport system duplicated ATPase subunit YejF
MDYKDEMRKLIDIVKQQSFTAPLEQTLDDMKTMANAVKDMSDRIDLRVRKSLQPIGKAKKKTAARIIEEMRESNNKTILMISHQLSVAATCDRVLVMERGEIIQEGKHKDLIKEKGLYKQLWEREMATKIVES